MAGGDWAAEHDFLFKVLVIGDAGVGKSCVIRRFVDDQFTPSYIATIGVDFKVHKLNVEGMRCKLQVWDTAGQERFRTVTSGYYRGANGVAVVYDVTDEQSFQSVEQWLREVLGNSGADVCRILIGNKVDAAARVVPLEDGERCGDVHGLPHFECSAKEGTGVHQAFQTLAANMLAQAVKEGRPKRRAQVQGAGVRLESKPEPEQRRRMCRC
eukprot:TRINITY_DN33832_c0_g1_i1.p2 TRINITY_DN33832_c0_g1~~TRINITY_DN33832_c0_g1_i1.p2  ORF type:complete len:228 (+),score=90.08 TRINITY_DN33832_c0_g1_i1:51-686(+)